MIGDPFSDSVLSAWIDAGSVRARLRSAAEIEAILQFEAALAGAEAELGLISDDAAARIETVCAGFTPDNAALRERMRRDGVVVPGLVAQLQEAVGAEAASCLHLGATSQDAIDTSLMLRMRGVLEDLRVPLAQVVELLDGLEAEHGSAQLTAYTRMRAAIPITVADRIAAWRAPLVGCRDTIPADLPAVQLGGPVGTLHTLAGKGPEVRARLARRMDLTDPGRSWHTDRTRVVAIGSWLGGLAAALGKLGADLALMAQDGIGAVMIDGGGSSSMPHKVNPVDAELIVALARHAGLLQGGLQQSAVHEYERSGVAWTQESLILPQLVLVVAAALAATTRLLGAVRALGDGSGGRVAPAPAS